MFSLSRYRPPDLQPGRLACNWMLLSAAFAIALHITRLPLWLSSLAVALLLWRLFIENFAWRIPGRLVRWLLLLVTTLAVFKEYGTLLGKDAGVAFMSVLVALKILEIRSLRDYLLAIFLIYLLVLGALLFSQSLVTGALAFTVVLVTTHALVLLNQPRNLSRPNSTRLVFMLVLQALPLVIVFYLLFPRIQGSLWGLPHDAFSGRTGMSEQVAPGSITQLHNDHTVAFRAEFKNGQPDPSVLYWRSLVLSDTNGKQWRRHYGAGDGKSDWKYVTDTLPVDYTVFVEPHYQKWIPTLDLPRSEVFGATKAPGYTLRSRIAANNLRRYDISSHLSYNTGLLSEEESAYNTIWPLAPSPRVIAQLEKWLSPPVTPKILVQRILDHFSQAPFRYTLSPPALDGDILDRFLFDSKAGYCEHYATSFVALMRLSGIPARLVVGYQGGEWNKEGDYLIVRQSDAHAWAEVSIPGEGWIRVDPTAAIAPERVELGAYAIRELESRGAGFGMRSVDETRRLIAPSWAGDMWQTLGWHWDSLNTGWDRWVMAYGPQAQRELVSLIGIKTSISLKLAVIMALGTALICFLISASWKFNRRASPDPVVKAYSIFCDKLRQAGYPRAPTEGPRDFAQRVSTLHTELGPLATAITDIYIALRYGQADPSELIRLQVLVAKLRSDDPELHVTH